LRVIKKKNKTWASAVMARFDSRVTEMVFSPPGEDDVCPTRPISNLLQETLFRT